MLEGSILNEEQIAAFTGMLAKHGFVDDPEHNSMNEIQMIKDMPTGVLIAWARDLRIILQFSQDYEATVGIVTTGDIGLLEQCIILTVGFFNTIQSMVAA